MKKNAHQHIRYIGILKYISRGHFGPNNAMTIGTGINSPYFDQQHGIMNPQNNVNVIEIIKCLNQIFLVLVFLSKNNKMQITKPI